MLLNEKVDEKHIAVEPEINQNKEQEGWAIKGCNSKANIILK